VNCIKWIRTHGLDTEGIFRMSADFEELQKTTNLFNEGASVDFEKLKPNAHLVCGILKKVKIVPSK